MVARKEQNPMIIDRAKGCLVGLALGDDNGGPTAMMLRVLEYITYNKLALNKYLCDTERCLNRAKDESNDKLIFEGFSYERRDN